MMGRVQAPAVRFGSLPTNHSRSRKSRPGEHNAFQLDRNSAHHRSSSARLPCYRRGCRIRASPQNPHSGPRNRFGSEYDREVMEHGSSRKAEAKLADRETRVDALKIRELGATERERFVAEWQTVQSRFVDHPKAAVTEADELIAALLEARGYPKDNFEQRAADVSVSSPSRDGELPRGARHRGAALSSGSKH